MLPWYLVRLALVRVYAGFHASGKRCGQNGPKFITPLILCQISKVMSAFFFLQNVDYGRAKKDAKFYSFGTFLGPKRLKNDEKWLNFAYHFSDDPE